ncbi:MAG: hypothetical protein FJX59_15650 [Alphaproteobacteria bacterium]|nr:hypothetical protein [Alphaproteobacteria bacterium]
MNSKTFTAIVATILFACTLGVLVSVGTFGVVRIFEQMAEGLGFLPQRWAENNTALLMEISGVAGVPVAAWFILWFYRKATTAERALDGYTYQPPKSGPDKA